MVRELKIDKDLRSLLRPLTKQEMDGLRSQIEADGCQDSIKVWKEQNTIVDGHHRYAICKQLGCTFAVEELSFADKGEAALWMVTHQWSRRNETEAAQAAARGLAYNMAKNSRGGDRKSEPTKSKVHGEPLIGTASKIASQTGVSISTVKRDAKFQESLAKLSTKAREAILAGEIAKPNHQALQRLQEYDAASQQALIAAVKSGEFTSLDNALDSQEQPEEVKEPEKPKSPEEQALQNGSIILEAAKLVSQAKSKISAMTEAPGMDLILARRAGLLRDLAAVYATIKTSVPVAICPKCKGKCCVHCGNHGWINSVMKKGFEA